MNLNSLNLSIMDFVKKDKLEELYGQLEDEYFYDRIKKNDYIDDEWEIPYETIRLDPVGWCEKSDKEKDDDRLLDTAEKRIQFYYCLLYVANYRIQEHNEVGFTRLQFNDYKDRFFDILKMMHIHYQIPSRPIDSIHDIHREIEFFNKMSILKHIYGRELHTFIEERFGTKSRIIEFLFRRDNYDDIHCDKI